MVLIKDHVTCLAICWYSSFNTYSLENDQQYCDWWCVINRLKPAEHLHGPLTQQMFSIWGSYVLFAGLAVSCLSLSSSFSRCCSFSSASFCFCCCSFKALFWQKSRVNIWLIRVLCDNNVRKAHAKWKHTFSLVVFSWSIIISFLMFTSLLW